MTFAKILILIVVVSVFAFTLYKLIMQIKTYKHTKDAKTNEIDNDTKKEVKP